MMKNFYYAFTRQGTLTIWFTAPEDKPELPVHVVPALTQSGKMQTLHTENLPIGQNELKAGGVALVIEYMRNYRCKYGNN